MLFTQLKTYTEALTRKEVLWELETERMLGSSRHSYGKWDRYYAPSAPHYGGVFVPLTEFIMVLFTREL